jgi:thymidylate kinase
VVAGDLARDGLGSRSKAAGEVARDHTRLPLLQFVVQKIRQPRTGHGHTLFGDLDPGEVPARIQRHFDRLEREGDDFRARTASGYRELAARFPDRIVVLDATRPADGLAEEVYGALRVRT